MLCQQRWSWGWQQDHWGCGRLRQCPVSPSEAWQARKGFLLLPVFSLGRLRTCLLVSKSRLVQLDLFPSVQQRIMPSAAAFLRAAAGDPRRNPCADAHSQWEGFSVSRWVLSTGGPLPLSGSPTHFTQKSSRCPLPLKSVELAELWLDPALDPPFTWKQKTKRLE